MNLITAQISFLSSHLAIVHIPNQFYQFFVQPLFRILFAERCCEGTAEAIWTDQHCFLNFSITPVGCSLICSTFLVDRYLRPLVEQFNKLITAGTSEAKTSIVEISEEDYVAIQVEGQGLDAGQRVLELTAPLAMSGISLFFITTYFSDYVLVPVRAKRAVVTTLQQRGFVFSEEAEAYVSQLSPMLNQNSPSFFRDGSRAGSVSGSEPHNTQADPIPTTPPVKDIPELQTRTFTKLMKNKIEPIVDKNLRLVNCAGSKQADMESVRRLKDDLTRIMLAYEPPSQALRRSKLSNSTILGLAVQDIRLSGFNQFSMSYLSLTLSNEPVSILMEESLLPWLGSTLFISRNEEDILTPIILDLGKLGWQATGIVGGVAGRLSQAGKSFELEHDNTRADPVDVIFLSAAKSASVIVQVNKLEEALEALKLGMTEAKVRK